MLIPLTHGKFATIDDDDEPMIDGRRWHTFKTGRYQELWYARASGNIYMHRVILNAPQGIEVDHKDHNGLNNTRQNLQFKTHRQNLFNQRKQLNTSSRFRGVTWFTPGQRQKRWMAQIKHEGKHRVIGYFLTEVEAARAYDAAALTLWGADAPLNFPLS